MSIALDIILPSAFAVLAVSAARRFTKPGRTPHRRPLDPGCREVREVLRDKPRQPVIHQWPPDDDSEYLTECCRRSPFDLPLNEPMTFDRDRVTWALPGFAPGPR